MNVETDCAIPPQREWDYVSYNKGQSHNTDKKWVDLLEFPFFAHGNINFKDFR